MPPPQHYPAGCRFHPRCEFARAAAGAAGPARDLLVERLEAADYPVSGVAIEERGESAVEVVATLTATSVEAKELDVIAADLARQPGIRHATWSVQAGD